MKHNKYLFFLFFIFLFSCYENINRIESNSITFIVNNSENIVTNIGTGIDIKTLKRFDYNTSNYNDTINVPTNKYRKIYLRNENVFKNIICKSGDTIFMNISINDIKININNRSFKKYDTLNINNLYNTYLKKQLIERKKMKKLFSSSQSIKSLEANHFSNYFKQISDIEKSSQLILNSFLNDSLINLPNYKHLKSQINYNKYIDFLEVYANSDENYLKSEVLKLLANDEIASDEFIAYAYLNRFINGILIKKHKFNYKQAFDNLPNFLSRNSLKYSKLICLKEIAKTYGYDTLETYFRNYLLSYNSNEDIKLIESIRNEFSYKKNFFDENDFKDLELIDLKGESLTFNQILKENSDKIIYLDFWASWCVPCRKAMPQFLKLIYEYENKKIVFVFISIDENLNNWKKASNLEGLNSLNYNFLATNFPESSFYNKINLELIPRYLLLNGLGELLNSNASSPNSNRIKSQLNELLTK